MQSTFLIQNDKDLLLQDLLHSLLFHLMQVVMKVIEYHYQKALQCF